MTEGPDTTRGGAEPAEQHLPEELAAEFWERIAALVREFDELPRSGGTVYGFAAGIYPTEHPMLPEEHDPDS